jgi:fibronectin-binding autotransporter adhesin
MLIAAASASLSLALPAFGQSFHTWNGGGGADNSWSNPANWLGGAPDGNDQLHFAGTTSLNPFNDLVGYSGYRIFFDTGAGAFTLDGNPITLFDFGGNNPKIENNSASTQTINFAITLNGDPGASSSAEINPVQGNLVFSQGITLADPGNTQLRIFGNNGRTVTFNGAISGDNSVAINQASNVEYLATNTYTGDTFVNAGTLHFGFGGSATSTTIRLGNTSGTADAAVNLAHTGGGQSIGNTIVVRAGSSGIKSLRASNTTGANTYAGNIFLDADVTTVSTNAGATLAFSGTTIDLKNFTMNITGAGDTFVSGNLVNPTTGETGKITKSGAGVATFGGTNTYRGSTTITGGVLSIDSDARLGTAPAAATAGHLTLSGGTLRHTATGVGTFLAANRGVALGSNGGTIDIPASTAILIYTSGQITGTGNTLTKAGAGTLRMTTPTSVTFGKLVVTGGLYQAGVDGHFGTATGADAITLNGGGISSNGGFTWSSTRGLFLGASGGTINTSSSATYAGTISGGGVLTKTGANTLTLTNANTFTGGIVLTAGTLSHNGESAATAGTPSATGAIPGSVDSDYIQISNNAVLQNTRTGSGITALATNKGITLGTGGGTWDDPNADSGNAHIYGGVITGTGPFTKTGAGVLSLTGLQTYSGDTNVNGGWLKVRTTSERFPDGSALTVAAGATFEIASGLSETMGSLAGGGTLAILGSGAATFGGSNSSTTYSGQVTGGTFNKAGSGVLTIQGNDWANTGNVNIVAGTIRFGNSAAGFSSSSTLTISSGAFLDMNGINDTFGALAGAGNIINGGTVTLASNNGTTYSGSYTGSGRLVKNGTGILTLTGSNGWAQVDFNDGRINFNNNGAAGSGAINVASTADEFVSSAVGIVLPNNIALASGALPKLYATSANSLQLNGQITGAGGFLRDDTGAGTVTLNGDNGFAGGISITSRGGFFFGHRNAAGTGVLGLGGASAPTNPITIQSNTNLTGVNAMANAVNFNQSFTIAGLTGLQFSGPVTLGAATPTVTVTNSAPTIFSGTINGPTGVGLTKAGPGVLTLSNTNSYTGPTTVNGGVLLANNLIGMATNGSATGSAVVNVNTGATLGGTGGVAGTTNINAGGTLAPGDNGIETLDTGALTFADGTSRYLVEISPDAPAVDRTNVTGGVTLNGAELELQFQSVARGVGEPARYFVIINNDGSDPVGGTLVVDAPTYAQIQVITNFTGIDETGFAADGNDVAIEVILIPEPSSVTMIAVISCALFRRRRRH